MAAIETQEGHRMTHGGKWTGYLSLWLLALAFGWIEATVVVYLRLISASGTASAADLPLVFMPSNLVTVEQVREACTLLVLGAVAWLAGRRPADRLGAFLLVFGLWDLTYYAVLRLLIGWPEGLATWDILFLIPVPWVAPVWAPATVAGLFVAAGSHLFWTAQRRRRYRGTEIAVLLASPLMILAAFLTEWKAVAGHRMPEGFPVPLFVAGVLLGLFGFLRAERRAA